MLDLLRLGIYMYGIAFSSFKVFAKIRERLSKVMKSQVHLYMYYMWN